MDVGIRELRNKLSHYVSQVRDGEEIVVTDHGQGVARLVPLDAPRVLDRLIREGLVEPAPQRQRSLPTPVAARGSVSALLDEQRR